MGSSRRGESRKTLSSGKPPRCDVCRRQGFAESFLSCERCITVQHTFCLPNPLVGLPERWLCPACSESSQRLYPSRRRKRSNSSGGSGGVGAGQGGETGGGNSPPSADTSQANGGVNANANPNGSTRAKGDKSAGAGAGDTAVAAPSATASSATSKRARKSKENGGALPTMVQDSKEAAKAAAGQDVSARRERPEQSHRPSNSLAESEREPLDPGSTVTLFCRRDFRRYLRWKRRELASQDDERRKEEQTRARKTFSSIVASSSSR